MTGTATMKTPPNKPKLARATLRTSRLMDFCNRKELITQTGHQPELWPLVVLKELVDNALDACEEAGAVPEIIITVDDDGITVGDNGPGLPEKTIEGVLDYEVRVSSREAYVAPDRGAQGNALKTIVAMPFVLHGERGRVAITTGGTRHEINFGVDPIRQEPQISHSRMKTDRKPGTEITVYWPDLACSILVDAKDRFLQFADKYTWLNPHLTLKLTWFNEVNEVAATAPDWPKWKPSDPTSAHWYTSAHLERLIAAYIVEDDDRTVREMVSEFRGLSGSRKQKAILDATGLARTRLADFCTDTGIDGDMIGSILAAMKTETKPVKPPALGIIGKDHLRQRAEAAGCNMETFDYRKVVGTTDSVPWVVETAFGGCPEADGRRLVVGVNWSPGIINPFRALGSYGLSLDTILSQQRADEDEPIILVLHMACPRAEFTDRGKSAVVIGG